MPKFEIPVTWEMAGTVEVEAVDLAAALKAFNPDDHELPLNDRNTFYVDGSFRLTSNDVFAVAGMTGIQLPESFSLDPRVRRARWQRKRATELCVDDMWASYPVFPREAWEEEAHEGNTSRGYWDWVYAQITELENDKNEEFKPELSEEMVNFFNVELRNEDEGGITPATLDSAFDSLKQAPEDVIADWTKLSITKVMTGRVHSELASLYEAYGPEIELRELLPDAEEN